MAVIDYIEYALGTLLSCIRGHDSKLFTKGPAFSDFPAPNINLECPECGPTGSAMHYHHTSFAAEDFPHLTWKDTPPGTVEYLLVVEDADSPIPSPVCHGIYYGIPASRNQLTAEEFHVINDGGNEKKLSGGFYYGDIVKGKHYIGARAVLGHGPHRYVYQLVALREKLDVSPMGGKVAKDVLGRAIEGKVGGWGVWIGTWERVWG
nr:maleidride PEBP type 2 [Wicklowia aquatica]